VATSQFGLDLNLLIALGALLEERNVTHAGDRIAMSQPAMSAALARLRKHFGDDLLHRTGRRYELTPFAEQLLPTVRRALRAAEGTLSPDSDFDPAVSDRRFTITMSDYAFTVLIEPLLSLLSDRAPHACADITPLPSYGTDVLSHLQRHDVMIGALGYRLPGHRQVVFRDRFVCVVAADNPRLADGALSLDDLRSMGHAVASFGPGSMTPADRALARHGIDRRVEVTVQGLLLLPFAVAGTDLCAFVPERLAANCAGLAGITIAQTPLGQPELVEAAHWHRARAVDPEVRWLLGLLREVGEQMEATHPALRRVPVLAGHRAEGVEVGGLEGGRDVLDGGGGHLDAVDQGDRRDPGEAVQPLVEPL
jgi:DNA-binding transcriptional LysR family regulator